MNLSVNERLVLQLIKSGQADSQMQLAEVLKLKPNTVHGITTRLERLGKIRRVETVRYGRGRPIQRFSIKYSGNILVIQWDGSSWSGALFSNGKVLGSEVSVQHPTPRTLTEVFRLGSNLVRLICSQAGMRPSSLASVMWGLRTLRRHQGWILANTNIPFILENSDSLFSKGLGLPVQLVLNTNMLVPELRLRFQENVRSLVSFHVGGGVGAQSVRSDTKWGGELVLNHEIGHIRVVPNGPRCACGLRGCLETLISGPAIFCRVQEDLKSGQKTLLTSMKWKTPEELFDLLEKLTLRQEDAYVEALVEDYLNWVSWGIATMFNLMRPDGIILSGYGLQPREAWRLRINEKLKGLSWQPMLSTIRLEFPRLNGLNVLREISKIYTGS